MQTSTLLTLLTLALTGLLACQPKPPPEHLGSAAPPKAALTGDIELDVRSDYAEYGDFYLIALAWEPRVSSAVLVLAPNMSASPTGTFRSISEVERELGDADRGPAIAECIRILKTYPLPVARQTVRRLTSWSKIYCQLIMLENQIGSEDARTAVGELLDSLGNHHAEPGNELPSVPNLWCMAATYISEGG